MVEQIASYPGEQPLVSEIGPFSLSLVVLSSLPLLGEGVKLALPEISMNRHF